MTELLLLGVAVLLTAACAVFVASEFSLTTVERGELERAAAKGLRGADHALKAVRRLTVQLSGAQLGITLTSLVIGMIAEPSVGRLLTGPLAALGIPASAAAGVSLTLATVLVTVFTMIFGELVPKNWAISNPLGMARVVALPQQLFTAAFGPLINGLNNTANYVVRRLGMEPTEELASARTPNELMALARHSAREGALEADTADLFVRTLRLSELTAQSVMTPRVQVRSLQDNATAADVINLTRATGLSRFPVYRQSLDDVVGVVHLKDALAVPADQRMEWSVGRLAAEPMRVPETLPVDQLLEQLRRRQTMAIVVDEYGGTAGVATLEDIVEEVVGQVRDEHDVDEAPEILPVHSVDGTPDSWEVDGGYRIDELERMGMRVPEGPYETLAGLLADRLGRIPAKGDTLEVAGWHAEVLSVEHHRAERVRLTAPSEPARPHEHADRPRGADAGDAPDAGTDRVGDHERSPALRAAARALREGQHDRGGHGDGAVHAHRDGALAHREGVSAR
ncbi:hemolysin family protein [Allostreptomyces psammosilenae]|uniref:CBS domain containing-hemolysin-like protein n=1 Tax=Allostreptomyces psammosilenae TaxID=1892865 RepID=A0A852ZP80_9ACTN|nr:hemolysin family protein [Allostreptomyces psammosilenae]NYI04256.1 CBS domain containing-hemolysin-like protein [Allostreptomyces psammosilenae]